MYFLQKLPYTHLYADLLVTGYHTQWHCLVFVSGFYFTWYRCCVYVMGLPLMQGLSCMTFEQIKGCNSTLLLQKIPLHTCVNTLQEDRVKKMVNWIEKSDVNKTQSINPSKKGVTHITAIFFQVLTKI